MSLPGQKQASTGLYVRAAPGLKLRDHKVQRLVQRMRRALPWLEDSDIPTARSWAQFEVLADTIYAALRAMGPIGPTGEGRRLLDDFRRLRSSQANLAIQLGMTPLARTQLKASASHVAVDLASAMANVRGDPDSPDDEPEDADNGASGDGDAAVGVDRGETLPVQSTAADGAPEGDLER